MTISWGKSYSFNRRGFLFLIIDFLDSTILCDKVWPIIYYYFDYIEKPV